MWTDVPEPLTILLNNQPYTKKLLQGFGSLLSVLKTESANLLPLPIGTLLSLPGKVVHAGPSSDKLRAVLFFTGTPSGDTPYSSDIQHTRTTLISEIIMHTWIPLQSNPDFAAQRKYLLRKWSEVGLENDTFALNNMHHVHLIEFAKAIMETKSRPKRETLLQDLASHLWEEEDWDNPDFKYRIPKVGGKKRKTVERANVKTMDKKRKARKVP